MFWEEKERKSIPMKVKRQVYKRAKGKCEKCGRSLKMNQGDFHHTRDPTVIPRASTVRFLCPTCHRIYGHKRVTRIRDKDTFWEENEKKIVRQEVVKIKKPAKKKPETRRVAVRDIFGDVIRYRTVKIRKPRSTKKKTATKEKTASSKKRRTTSKKTTRKKTKSKKATKPKRAKSMKRSKIKRKKRA